MYFTAGDVTSPAERSRDVQEYGESSALSHTPEVVSEHIAAALRSLTLPFHDVIMAAGPLLFPYPFLHPPGLSLCEFAPLQDPRTLPEIARPLNDGEDAASGSGSRNDSASCDEDSEHAVCGIASVLPLDLSPPRSGRRDDFHHHGNNLLPYRTEIMYDITF